MFSRRVLASICLMVGFALTSCGGDDRAPQPESISTKTSDSTAVDESQTSEPITTNEEEFPQVEKVKPAAGTGNVQGVVLYNGKPVKGIEVKLCEKFSRFFGGCDGKTYTAKTDSAGVYVITNVEPKTYESLLARVFNTDSWVFATSGFIGISAQKYEVPADKTLFIRPTNLFKSDLKVGNPKAGSTVSAQGLTLQWEAYPDAAYYKFSLFPDSSSITAPYINRRVDSNAFVADKPVPLGTYRWEVEAFNANDKKLAENSDDIKFTVK